MPDSRFGYLGFVPGTRIERSFVRAEENDAQCEQVAAMIDDACLETQAAKVQMEPMKEKKEQYGNCNDRQTEGIADSHLTGVLQRAGRIVQF